MGDNYLDKPRSFKREPDVVTNLTALNDIEKEFQHIADRLQNSRLINSQKNHLAMELLRSATNILTGKKSDRLILSHSQSQKVFSIITKVCNSEQEAAVFTLTQNKDGLRELTNRVTFWNDGTISIRDNEKTEIKKNKGA